MKLDFSFHHADTVGMPTIIGCKGPTSKCGGCFCCDVPGVPSLYPGTNTCYYPSAIRLMPFDHPFRKMFAEEFAMEPRIAEIAKLGPPNLMTTEEAVASAERATAGPVSARSEEPFKFKPVWYENFQQNFIDRSTYDCYHEMSHGLEDMFSLALNVSGNMTFKISQQEYEQQELCRWSGVANTQANRYPWRVSIKCQARIALLMKILKKHSTWHRIKHLGSKPNVGRVNRHVLTTSLYIMYYVYNISTVYIMYYVYNMYI